MATKGNAGSDAGAAWRCDGCGVWWGSQVGARPKTRFLLSLPEHVAQALPWEDYRGWKPAGPQANVCPECQTPAPAAHFSRP